MKQLQTCNIISIHKRKKKVISVEVYINQFGYPGQKKKIDDFCELNF